MMQLLDMMETNLTWLPNYMDHSKSVHFDWYRKEYATIELNKVAKVFSVIVEDKDITNEKTDGLICADNKKGYCFLTYVYVTEFVTYEISRFLFKISFLF